MNSTEIFNLAYKLEEAQRILLTLAERLRKDEDKSKTIDLINGVPF